MGQAPPPALVDGDFARTRKVPGLQLRMAHDVGLAGRSSRELRMPGWKQGRNQLNLWPRLGDTCLSRFRIGGEGPMKSKYAMHS